MNLTRIIYLSQRNLDLEVDLHKLLVTCNTNNTRDRITGFLYFGGTYFLQVLEGLRATTNALYNKIAVDKRHSKVTMIQCVDVHERRFANWSMGYHQGMDDSVEEIFLRYFATTVIDPNTVHAESLLNLMRDLATDSGDRALAALMARDAANNARGS